MISKSNRLKNLDPKLLEKSLNMENQDQQLKSGGTSGVGGGGDYRVQFYVDLIYFKISRMMGRKKITVDQVQHLTCFLADKIDFDIEPQLAPGDFRTEIQSQSSGTERLKIFFPTPKSFGTRGEERYLEDYDQFLPTMKILLSIFLGRSSNACFY